MKRIDHDQPRHPLPFPASASVCLLPQPRIAIAATIGFGSLTSGTMPVQAEAVRVESAQAPGFGDVVEKVSPAVVSVR